ncbi:hypothetical protein LCGC14_1510680 [marine sediment metagenome]|uniref:RNA polymerase sigma-70 region 2 domain-containing protein n=1 Tax=marine sediment metagenome TaxID=412755 RepID=A0A0F9LGV8_9ZZZZ
MRIEHYKNEDRILLKKAIDESCPEILGRIYKRYKPFISRYIAQKVRIEDDNQSIAQTVFLRLCQGKCKYSGDSDVQGYLCGIAKNVLRDYFKAKKRRVKVHSLAEIEVIGDLLVMDSCDDDPLENLQNVEIRLIFRKVVAKLPPKSRQAVELVYLDGIKPPDAAKQLGCNAKTLRDRLYSGISKLREELQV